VDRAQHPSSRFQYIAGEIIYRADQPCAKCAEICAAAEGTCACRRHIIGLRAGNGDMFLSIPHRMFADILLFELCCRNCAEVNRCNGKASPPVRPPVRPSVRPLGRSISDVDFGRLARRRPRFSIETGESPLFPVSSHSHSHPPPIPPPPAFISDGREPRGEDHPRGFHPSRHFARGASHL
jgi:hypothetical protein